MYSVGVLSGDGRWPEVLARALEATGSAVSGWVNPSEVPGTETHQLIDFSDLIWIPEKIGDGMEEAIRVIRRSRHLSLGFPVAEFMDEAPCMLKLATEAHVQVQVGHSDWHRPALRSVLSQVDKPQYIGITEHLADFPPEESAAAAFRAVVADLDLALGLAASPVRKVRPHVSRLRNGSVFHADIRVELHNGAVIRIDLRKSMPEVRRSLEIIQAGSVIDVDLAAGRSRFTTFREHERGTVPVVSELWPPAPGGLSEENRIQPDEDAARRCLSFIRALQRGRHFPATLEAGCRALEIARQAEMRVGSF